MNVVATVGYRGKIINKRVFGKMRKFITKYWLFILLATIATILAGFYFRNKISPFKAPEKLLSLPTPIIKSHPISISPNISQLQEKFPSFNQKVLVYQVSPSSFSDQKAISIGKKFGFSTPPTVSTSPEGGISYGWIGEENSLSINLRRGGVYYNLDILKHPEFIEGELPLYSEVEEKVKSFLEENEFSPPEGVELKTKNIFYVKNYFPYFNKVDKREEADLIQVDFEHQVNGNKIITIGDYPPVISIIIGPESKIVIFNYYFLSNKVEPLKDFYPLKTKDEVLKDIEANPRISYLSTFLVGVDNPTPEDYSQLITNLTFDTIEFGYLKYDPLQSYLQPVFLITGKARLKDGQEGEVGVYIPAIKEEYLLK
jgi:hypothetical protein